MFAQYLLFSLVAIRETWNIDDKKRLEFLFHFLFSFALELKYNLAFRNFTFNGYIEFRLSNALAATVKNIRIRPTSNQQRKAPGAGNPHPRCLWNFRLLYLKICFYLNLLHFIVHKARPSVRVNEMIFSFELNFCVVYFYIHHRRMRGVFDLSEHLQHSWGHTYSCLTSSSESIRMFVCPFG